MSLIRVAGRTIGVILLLLFAAASVFFAWAGFDLRRQFEEWRDDEPVHLTVDLSSPGIYTGTLSHTCWIAHGWECLLEVSPAPESMEKWTNALSGFRGTVTIGREAARPPRVENLRADRLLLSEWDGDIECRLLKGYPVTATGDYAFTLQVIEPASGMTGRSQQIRSHYLFCGLESKLAVYLFTLATISGILALACGLVVRRSIRRHRAPAPGPAVPPEDRFSE